jgi:hypothetical protein
MEDVGKFYGPLVYFVAIWYDLWLFGILFPVSVCCTKKNLATLVGMTAFLKSINFRNFLFFPPHFFFFSGEEIT